VDDAVVRLEDLPTFRVFEIRDSNEPELAGMFSHLRGVRAGRSWLYAGERDSLIGDLSSVDESRRTATFTAPFWSSASPIQVGSVVPWLDGWWRPYHVSMIVDQAVTWTRTEFVPARAVHFRQGDVHGWTREGMALPDDAVVTRVDPGGWDHEHCELCNGRIGVATTFMPNLGV
jgi:hypothetical protein